MGVTITAGTHLASRREILGRLALAYITIEGGPGTAHEASIAMQRGGLLIPVACSGGHSADLYREADRPQCASAAGWSILGNDGATPADIALAIRAMIVAVTRSQEP